MMPDNLPEKKWLPGLMILFTLSLIVMSLATLYDRTVTAFLAEHEWQALSVTMGRTIFEGDLPGANDPLVILLIASLVVYVMGWRFPQRFKWVAYRPHAGFVLITALVIAFLLVHGIKLSMGRARPYMVFNHGMPFTPWYSFGPLFIANGLFSGSFPSGHTAQIFSATAFCYILAADPIFGKKIRLLGWVWGALMLILCLAMATARCMSSSHWLTDVLGSICLGSVIMHFLYHWLLFVPDQRRYVDLHRGFPKLPSLWELRIGGFLLFAAAGLVAFVSGVRSPLLGQSYWMMIGIPIGACLIFWSSRKVARIRRMVRKQLSLSA
jgi:membrane-associated phospholipid phosphatase